jgi:L-aspartate oxidase
MLAWWAGAHLADLEFVQFHPTALNLPGAPAYLLSEALRGDGALLVDSAGKQIVNPLLARDVVARAVARHLKTSGPVYLTLRHLDPSVKDGFLSISEGLAKYGLDLARDLIPVAPAAHYCMGGIRTDVDGRSTLPGLYAAGEVACTGVQGANRLASNSLLECLVFGRRAALAAIHDEPAAHAEWPLVAVPGDDQRDTANVGRPSSVVPPIYIMEEQLGERLDLDLGVERTASELEKLISDLPDPYNMDSTSTMPTGQLVAALAARSALIRTESRGAHYRSDYPETKPEWRGRITWLHEPQPQFEEVPLCN